MTEEANMNEVLAGQKLPRDMELVMTAFLPNIKHLETRFDYIDLAIKDLGIGVKDTNYRLTGLEKRMDYFEVQVDKRFERLTEDVRDLKGDVHRRFEKVETDVKEFKSEVRVRFDKMETDAKEFKGEVRDRFDKMETDAKEFKGEVKDRFEKMEQNVNDRFEKMEISVKDRFEKMGAEVKEFKGEVKQRFENVDRRFDQIAASIERLGDKLDARDARQRAFTMRMFGVAITLSFLGVMGVLVKAFGVL